MLEVQYIFFVGPNFWQLQHLSGFGIYISTLVTVYPIFILAGSFGVLKLRIYIFVRIVGLFFLMDICWASVTPCFQGLVFISFAVLRKRYGLFTIPFDRFRELWE